MPMARHSAAQRCGPSARSASPSQRRLTSWYRPGRPVCRTADPRASTDPKSSAPGDTRRPLPRYRGVPARRHPQRMGASGAPPAVACRSGSRRRPVTTVRQRPLFRRRIVTTPAMMRRTGRINPHISQPFMGNLRQIVVTEDRHAVLAAGTARCVCVRLLSLYRRVQGAAHPGRMRCALAVTRTRRGLMGWDMQPGGYAAAASASAVSRAVVAGGSGGSP
jgi:hypothetical protein